MTTVGPNMRRWRLAAILPLALVACGEAEGGSEALEPGEFVDIIVALRQAEREVRREAHQDSVELEFERRKAGILERHDVTEEEIRGFLERHRDRPRLIASVWDSVAQRLRSPPVDVGEEAPLPDDEW